MTPGEATRPQLVIVCPKSECGYWGAAQNAESGMTISAADEKTYIRSLSKRAFDIVVATAGLLLLSPLILVISFWITTESSGPILCRRKRYSSNNVELEVFEFRTTLVVQQKRG
jgi:lipopolysaccharide/colanic/teichoic acid biosynthesis glycosyltransferase